MIAPLPSTRSILFCTSFEADVNIQLPIMQAFRRRGDRIAVLSLDLQANYDPGRRLLQAAGIDYIAVTAEQLPAAGSWLDTIGPFFSQSRLLHQPEPLDDIDPELKSLIAERATLFSRAKERYVTLHREKMDWIGLCGFTPDSVFMCSSLVRFKLVIEMARRDGIPLYNYWHGFMHPATFATPFEYWWVNHPVAWGPSQVSGYAACGCPTPKLLTQAPGQYACWTRPEPSANLFAGNRPTILINAQGVQSWKAGWPFRCDTDLEEWIAGIGKALAGFDVNVIYKEHPANGRRMQATCERIFAGQPFRFVFDEIEVADLVGTVDMAIMVASTTAIDFMVAGVPLVCYDPFASVFGGWQWSTELTDRGAALSAATVDALREAIRQSLAAGRSGTAPPALAAFLAHASKPGFEAFIDNAREATIAAILRRAQESAQAHGVRRILWLNGATAADRPDTVLASRGVLTALRQRFPDANVDIRSTSFTRRFANGSPRTLDAMEQALNDDTLLAGGLVRDLGTADLVIIEGGDAFAASSDETYALLFFAYAAARLGKACVVVNASFDLDGMSEAELRLCRGILAGIRGVQVREPVSFHRMRDAGFPCDLGADGLYLGLAPAARHERPPPPVSRVLLSAGPALGAGTVETVAASLLDRLPTPAHEYVLLCHDDSERALLSRIAAITNGRLIAFDGLGAEAFIDLLAGARIIVTGWERDAAAAAALGVPFLPLASADPGLAAACHELGVAIEPFAASLDRILNGGDVLRTHLRTRAGELAEIARQTFDRL